MTKIVEHKAEFIYDVHTDISDMDGYPEFIQDIVGAYRRWVWKRRMLRMNDRDIYDEYYRLTRKVESDDFKIGEPVIRDTDR